MLRTDLPEIITESLPGAKALTEIVMVSALFLRELLDDLYPMVWYDYNNRYAQRGG